LIVSQTRWTLTTYTLTPPDNWFVNFVSQGGGKYVISYQSLNYYFGSVAETRFYFDSAQKVFDPRSGILLQDYVDVLATNINTITNVITFDPADLPAEFEIGGTDEIDIDDI
jgi:hypothetical protein